MREKAKALGIKVDGRWSEARIQQEIDKVNAKVEGAEYDHVWEGDYDAVNKFITLEWANERAAKIWEGQSPTLSILERVGRIKLALKKRGFIRFDDLVIPTTEDYKMYL